MWDLHLAADMLSFIYNRRRVGPKTEPCGIPNAITINDNFLGAIDKERL